MAAKDSVGRYGERIAARYLVAQGFAIMDRNWRCEVGEIDIIARDGDWLVMCEVKTRRSLVCGQPAEAVDARKLQRLRQLTVRWLLESGLHPPQIRIDVVGVLCPIGEVPQIQHLRAVS
jgi:putative endonuclease